MNRYQKEKAGATRYTVECLLCGRRFDIPATKGPVVPFHLSLKGFRCPGANNEGRVVKNTI